MPVAHWPVLGVVPPRPGLVFMLDPRRVGVMMVVVTEGGGGPVEVVPSRHRGRRGGRGRVLVWVAAGRGGGRAAY